VRFHIEALGWLHLAWGAFGVLTGVSLLVLAAGTRGGLAGLDTGTPTELAAVWVLALSGIVLAAFGGMMALVGYQLRRGSGSARRMALILALPNLVLVPFGTALGGYTLWVLLNDDARRAFGRPPRLAP